MLQILVVGGNHTHHSLLVQLFENGLRYRRTDLRFRAATKFIDKNQCFLATTAQKRLHILQVRTVCTQIVLNRLLVAYVHKHALEHAHMRVFVKRGQHATLHHILHHTHRFQAHRLTASVRSRNDEYAIFFGQLNIQWHHLFSMFTKREEKGWVLGMIPFNVWFLLQLWHVGIHV